MSASVDDLLNQAQSKCSRLDGSDSPKMPMCNRGMGAISLSYNPFLCKWRAKADWSDFSKIKTEFFEEPAQALSSLIKELNKALSDNQQKGGSVK